MTPRIEVSVHTERSGEVGAVWQALYHATPGVSPGLGPGFAELIESTFAPPGTPLWLLAHQGGRPIGLLHLRRETRWLGPVPQRRILGGLGWHGYATELLAAEGEHEAVAAAFMARMTRWQDGSALHWWRIPAGGALATTPSVAGRLEATVANPFVIHGPTPQRLSGKPGANQRRLMRQLASLGEVSLQVVRDPAASTAIAARFTHMHSALKTVQGQHPVFDMTPGSHERFPAQWAACCAAGLGSALVLRLDDAPIAIGLQLHGPDVSASWRVARDPALGRYSLGLALMDEAIEQSRLRGDRRYDLGPGDEEYKRLWDPTSAPCYRLRMLAPGVRTLGARVYCRWTGDSIV